MGKAWDSISKRLSQHSVQAILDRFVPEATFVRFLPVGLEPITKRGKKKEEAQQVDTLIVAQIDGEEVLILIELQTRNDYEMPWRLLEYTRRVVKKYHKWPLTCVLYLLVDGQVPLPPLIGRAGPYAVLDFDYRSKEVGKWDAQKLLVQEDIDLLPLLPLCDGVERLL